MDEDHPYFDQRAGTFATADMPKVYHLNAIALCVDQANDRRTLARWRVVVNQDGVVHIDPIIARRREASGSAASLVPAAAE